MFFFFFNFKNIFLFAKIYFIRLNVRSPKYRLSIRLKYVLSGWNGREMMSQKPLLLFLNECTLYTVPAHSRCPPRLWRSSATWSRSSRLAPPPRYPCAASAPRRSRPQSCRHWRRDGYSSRTRRRHWPRVQASRTNRRRNWASWKTSGEHVNRSNQHNIGHVYTPRGKHRITKYISIRAKSA